MRLRLRVVSSVVGAVASPGGGESGSVSGNTRGCVVGGGYLGWLGQKTVIGVGS